MAHFGRILNALTIAAVALLLVGLALYWNCAGRCNRCGGPTFDKPATIYHKCLICGRLFLPGESGKPLWPEGSHQN
jgi:hypothetical protein